MRGGTFEQTLILVDGFRMNDLQTGHHDMDLPFPVDSFSDVEVLHGAGSTLYGSDAVGGAINFITRPPPVTELRVRTGFGNFGVNQESATGSLVDGSLAEQLIFARDYSSGFMPDRDYRDLALTSLTDFSTELGNSELILAHNDRPFGANQFYGPYDSWEHTNTYFVGAKQDLGKSTQVSFAYRHHRDRFVLFRENPLYYQNLHALQSFQAALRRRQLLSKNTHFFYGAEGYSDSIHSTNLGDHTRGRVAAYAALDVRALRRFSFNIGAREEVYRSVQGQFSPSVSAGYWLNSHLKFRGNVSHAFRVPSMTDLYYHDPTSVGNPNLRPERAWDYETGLEWNGARRLHGDLTLFDLREQDVIDYDARLSHRDLAGDQHRSACLPGLGKLSSGAPLPFPRNRSELHRDAWVPCRRCRGLNRNMLFGIRPNPAYFPGGRSCRTVFLPAPGWGFLIATNTRPMACGMYTWRDPRDGFVPLSNSPT